MRKRNAIDVRARVAAGGLVLFHSIPSKGTDGINQTNNPKVIGGNCTKSLNMSAWCVSRVQQGCKTRAKVRS